MLKRFFSLPVQIIFLVLIAVFFHTIIPLELKRLFYTLSLILKGVLIFGLPFIVFSYLYLSMMRLGKGALPFIATLFIAISFSNFSSIMVSYGLCKVFLDGNISAIQQTLAHSEEILKPLWLFSFKPFVSNDIALFSGIVLGVLSNRIPLLKAPWIERVSENFSRIFLEKFFVPMIPLFIFGFAIKLQEEGQLPQIYTNYSYVIILIMIAQVIYTTSLYFLAARFSMNRAKDYIKNMLPATMTGFTSMSSAAAMPLTLIGSLKNTNDNQLVRGIVPTTTNIHLMGDSICVPIMAITIMMGFGKGFPSFDLYMVFAMYFVLVKFAVAGVPGGGVLVIVPVIEKYMGFTPEMTGLLTAIYLLFDSVNTSMNVHGNGAFALLFLKVWDRLLRCFPFLKK